MTSVLLKELLQSLALLSVFLLLGTFLRAKVKIFQKTFLPASVIGGFLLLIFGPIVLNLLPIPGSWITTYSLLPGILIVPIVASVPLGLRFGKAGSDGIKPILPLFFIMSTVAILQYIVGFLVNLGFSQFGYDLYASFGWELGLGFSGGHGTAGLLGNMLQSMNLPYWETSQGIAVTTATFGIIGGIILGMIMINWAARKGQTSILKNPSDIPENMRVGYEKDIAKQLSLGRETTLSSSIDTITFHLAIILSACGIAYIILDFVKSAEIPGLSTVSIWAYAILVMFGIWYLMRKLKLDYLVDGKVKSKIASVLTEFAVIAAVASLPVQTVMTYIVPILVMVVLGFIFTALPLIYLSKKYIKDNWFEHMIAAFGMSTGVFLTGLLLLKICDPEMESPVLGNYSLAYTMVSVIAFALLPVFLNIILAYGPLGMVFASSLFFIVYLVGTIVSSKKIFDTKDVV